MSNDRRFRFGLVAGPNRDAAYWSGLGPRAESLGYSTVLVPDTAELGSTLPAAALLAGATTTLRVGTFVLVAAARPAAATAWETETLDRLTGGRFELGLGTGRPDADRLATLFGTELGGAADRVAAVEATVAATRKVARSPILIAGAGPRILTVAARDADIISFALGPDATETALAAAVDLVRNAAPERLDQIELSNNLLAVGDGPADFLRGWLGRDPAELAAAGSLAVLFGTPTEIADELQRRRDRYGTSYITVNAESIDALAPVVERLAGR